MIKAKHLFKFDQLYINLHRGLSIQTIVIIFFEEIAFLITALFARIFFPFIFLPFNNISHPFGLWFGIILSIAIVLGFVNTIVLKIAYRSFKVLVTGIQQIADGDYSVRLTQKNHDFLKPLYDDFNKMAAELEKTSILRNDFINSYSHEFKTPIAAINGFANLMLRQHVSEKDQQQYLEIIRDESKRLADLASDTLLLSKLDMQEIITDRKVYSLDEQLRTCVIMLSSGWNKKNITFTGNFTEVQYRGNEEIMQHLWLNLLSNAIKFTPSGGEIIVSLVQNSGEVLVTVSDTGIGMDSNTIDHIFEKYYQGTQSLKKNGLGLGLSIVQRIVQLCGGFITVKSATNEGSSFYVHLPLV